MSFPIILALGWVFACALTPIQERVSAPPERAYSAFGEDDARQFDFWIGSWDVNLRMRQEDGTFEDAVRARAHIYSILEGRALLELWDSEPIKGFSLRYFDPEADAWRLWLNWPSENGSRTASLSGSFRHGRGDFVSERESEDGRPLLARYSFNDITPFSLRWDDHYSTDGGETWQPRWIMEFSRTALEPEWPIPGNSVPTAGEGTGCTLDAFRGYESLAGEWEGTLTSAERSEAARMSAYRILDGCAAVAFVEAREWERFFFLTYDTSRGAWELDRLTSDPTSELERFFGDEAWTELASETGDGRFRWRLRDDTLEYEMSVNGADERGTFERR